MLNFFVCLQILVILTISFIEMTNPGRHAREYQLHVVVFYIIVAFHTLGPYQTWSPLPVFRLWWYSPSCATVYSYLISIFVDIVTL